MNGKARKAALNPTYGRASRDREYMPRNSKWPSLGHPTRSGMLEEAQRKNPPMDAERWNKMDPLEVYWEIEIIRRKLNADPEP